MSQLNGIAGSQQFPVATSGTGKAERTDVNSPTGGTQASKGAAGTDQANVSTAANTVVQALAGSDVRVDRVTALQGSITAGTYNISGSDVASKVFSALLS